MLSVESEAHHHSTGPCPRQILGYSDERSLSSIFLYLRAYGPRNRMKYHDWNAGVKPIRANSFDFSAGCLAATGLSRLRLDRGSPRTLKIRGAAKSRTGQPTDCIYPSRKGVEMAMLWPRKGSYSTPIHPATPNPVVTRTQAENRSFAGSLAAWRPQISLSAIRCS